MDCFVIQDWKKITRFAARMARKYGDPFLAEEAEQIAYLSHAAARATWQPSGGASPESWTYFYIRRYIAEASEGSKQCITSVVVHPSEIHSILGILNVDYEFEHVKLVLDRDTARKVNDFLKTYCGLELNSRKLEVVRTPDNSLRLTGKFREGVQLVSFDEETQGDYRGEPGSESMSEIILKTELDLTNILVDMVESLPQDHRKVIVNLYGIKCSEKSVFTLSRELGWCPQKVRRIEKEALGRLRQGLLAYISRQKGENHVYPQGEYCRGLCCQM